MQEGPRGRMRPNRKNSSAGRTPRECGLFFARIISIMLETFGILNIWAYALGALIIVMIPGPNTLFVLKTSIVDGRRAGFTAAAGVFTGDAVLVFLAYLGIAALVLAHPEVFFWLKILGAAYLAWLGGKAIHATFFAKKAEKAEGESEVVVKKSRSLVKVYHNALALSLTNPKSILFYVSFFVQFIDPAFDNPAISYTILALILECFSMAWMTLLITAGADLLKFFGRRPSVAKLGNTAMGSMFLLFASKLALDA